MTAFKSLVGGQRFGRWTVIERVASDSRGHARYRSQCDCGQIREIRANHLRSGRSTSCGCFSREATAARSTRHGHATNVGLSPTFRSWQNMKARCTNPRVRGYERYGGRGVKVCAEWQNDFGRFLSDMGTRPSLKHSIERINNNGIYEPGNCRWATHAEQARNRRNNHIVEYRGRKMSAAEAAEIAGVSHKKVLYRLSVGRDIERALYDWR
jgi:hypothetical protein